MYWVEYLIKCVYHALMLVSWALLATLAVNSLTRKASWIICAFMAGTAVFSLIIAFQGVGGKALSDLYLWLGFLGLWKFLGVFVSLYWLSNIYRNVHIGRCELSWLMLIPLSHVPVLTLMVANIFWWALPEGFIPEHIQAFMNPRAATLFGAMFDGLLMVAYWKLVHCGAFTGNYDATTQCTATFKTRYFWAPLIAALLTCGFFYAIAVNANGILNLMTT